MVKDATALSPSARLTLEMSLLKNKRALVGFARGGLYRGTEADTQTPYFKAWLKFVGIEDVQFIYAEGLNMGEEACKAGFATAEQDLASALSRL